MKSLIIIILFTIIIIPCSFEKFEDHLPSNCVNSDEAVIGKIISYDTVNIDYEFIYASLEITYLLKESNYNVGDTVYLISGSGPDCIKPIYEEEFPVNNTFLFALNEENSYNINKETVYGLYTTGQYFEPVDNGLIEGLNYEEYKELIKKTSSVPYSQKTIIYPNPTQALLYNEINDMIQSIRIIDINGRELIQSKSKSINVSFLKKGLYFIEIKTSKETYLNEFIKN